jgi:integrase
VLALRVQDLDFHHKLIKVRCSAYAGQIGLPRARRASGTCRCRLRSNHVSGNTCRRATTVRTISASCSQIAGHVLTLRINCERKSCARCLRSYEYRWPDFTSFRHAVASELIDSGAPITVVQAQLRHSDPRITLGLYGHVIPQSQRDAVGSLAARLADNRRKNRLQLPTRPRIADSIA